MRYWPPGAHARRRTDDVPTAPALHFAKESGATLPADGQPDSDKAFTIAAWVYLPKLHETYAVASQLENCLRRRALKRKAKGAVDGHLSIHGEGPMFRLQDDDGKYLYADPGPGFLWMEKDLVSRRFHLRR